MARKYVAALTRALPWLLAALAAAVLVVSAVLFISSSGFGYDFLAYDAAARRLAAGVTHRVESSVRHHVDHGKVGPPVGDGCGRG